VESRKNTAEIWHFKIISEGCSQEFVELKRLLVMVKDFYKIKKVLYGNQETLKNPQDVENL
jgi:hypothetical protein